MRRHIFRVYGYHTLYSPASFKLDLRSATKKCPDYFARDNEMWMGGYLFGIPDTWKGLFGMTYEETAQHVYQIDIFIDTYRDQFTDFSLQDYADLIRCGLKLLQNLEIIEKFEEVEGDV